jgi:hypothetical protein
MDWGVVVFGCGVMLCSYCAVLTCRFSCEKIMLALSAWSAALAYKEMIQVKVQ